MPTIHISDKLANRIEQEKSGDEPPTRTLENLIQDNKGPGIDEIRMVIREELRQALERQ